MIEVILFVGVVVITIAQMIFDRINRKKIDKLEDIVDEIDKKDKEIETYCIALNEKNHELNLKEQKIRELEAALDYYRFIVADDDD